VLKISVKDMKPQKQRLLEVEGRLAGPWVEELERSWDTERRKAPCEDLIVRLSNVTFIDETGRELLGKIFHAGSKLEGNGCMVRAIISRITGGMFPAHDCESETKKGIAAQSGGGQGERE
jgi:anti-anti-sigma regulatory factor